MTFSTTTDYCVTTQCSQSQTHSNELEFSFQRHKSCTCLPVESRYKVLPMRQAIGPLEHKYHYIVHHPAVAVRGLVRYAIPTPLRFAFLTYSSAGRKPRASL